MHPYREHTLTRRENEGARALARARWATLLSAIPLVILAVTFFVPLEGGRAPSDALRARIELEDVIALLYVWPPYFVAALLVTILAITAGRLSMHRPGDPERILGPIPGPTSRSTATWGVACSFISAPALVALVIALSSSVTALVDGFLVFSALLAAALGGFFLIRMRRARGWRRWGFLLAAYAASTCPLSALHIFIVANTQRATLGTLTYGLAIVMVWAHALTAIWPARRRGSPTARVSTMVRGREAL